MAAFCKRVPAFPLAQGEALLRETTERLDESVTPEILDGLYSTLCTIRREFHANPEPGFGEHKTHALLRRLLVELAQLDEENEALLEECARLTQMEADIAAIADPEERRKQEAELAQERTQMVNTIAQAGDLQLTEIGAQLDEALQQALGVTYYGILEQLLPRVQGIREMIQERQQNLDAAATDDERAAIQGTLTQFRTDMETELDAIKLTMDAQSQGEG